ncbi:hypothetical protein [Alkalicoccobacillus gibsonii]|uniref:hypothetical protein n=1 Tax=Alkalicoccobacillus gibsonii TaxID=79881 RepID=UPI00193214AF|nr:hypothetical protein [Alkalicoccobacillus gibsonii]MBM0067955.1 hypothetical protein [Alkalicoccobacillus gibsonii]
MDKRYLLFGSGLVVLAGVTVLNLWAMNQTNDPVDVAPLHEQIRELNEDNTLLTERLERMEPEQVAAEREAITNVAYEFIQLAYNRDFNQYEEERAAGRAIMNDELYDRFFPADQIEANEEIETDVIMNHLYLEDKEPTADVLYAVADFHHIIDDTEIDRQEERDVLVSITIEKTGENEWMVNDLSLIQSEVSE